jgi:hypothetical protein
VPSGGATRATRAALEPTVRPSRRTLAAAVLLAAMPLLAACSTADATTSQQPSGNGASATVGPLQLRAITIVKAGAGVPLGSVIGTIVNTGTEADTLTSVQVTSPAGSTTTISGAIGSIPIPAQGRVQIGQTTQIGQAAINVDTPAQQITIKGLTIAPTAFAQVVFTFQKAGQVTVPTMAVPPTGIYAGYGPLSG